MPGKQHRGYLSPYPFVSFHACRSTVLCRLPATSYTHQVAYPCPYTLSRQASANLLHFDVSSKTPSFVIQNNAIFKFPIESEFDKMYIPTAQNRIYYFFASIKSLHIQVCGTAIRKRAILSIERRKRYSFLLHVCRSHRFK